MTAAPPQTIPGDVVASLRVHPEPFDYISEEQVHHALTKDPVKVLDRIESSLEGIATGALTLDLPPKVIVGDGDGELAGDFRSMPCVLRGPGFVLKTVKVVGTNLVQQEVPDQITVGKAMVLHPTENYITHILEACLLSSARTGICAATATRHLAGRRSRLRILGAGRVGLYCGFYLAALGGVDEVVFDDLDLERARATAMTCNAMADGRARVVALCDDPGRGEDVLVIATTSTSPFCSPAETSAALVVSVGADTVAQRELDARWMAVADLFTDSDDSFHVGDLHAWTREGRVDEHEVGTLLSVIAGRVPMSRHERRVFVSTGSALMDNLAIGYVLESIGTSAASA